MQTRLYRQQTKHAAVLFSKTTVKPFSACVYRTVNTKSRVVVYVACLSWRSYLSPGERSIVPNTGVKSDKSMAAPTCSESLSLSRSGELRTQKLKSHQMRTQSRKVFPLKPGAGQYIAMHATLTAMDFFLANFYPSGSFTCIFSKTSPGFFLC